MIAEKKRMERSKDSATIEFLEGVLRHQDLQD